MMRTAWIGVIATLAWNGPADARPATARYKPQRVQLADQWKSPVKAAPAEATVEQRWRLPHGISYDVAEQAGIRWKLRGAKVKLWMPFALR